MPTPQELGVQIGTRVRFAQTGDWISPFLLKDAARQTHIPQKTLRAQVEWDGNIADCVDIKPDSSGGDYYFRRVLGNGRLAKNVTRIIGEDEDVLDGVVPRK